MTEQQFWTIMERDDDAYRLACEEVARIRVYDYDCEDVDWKELADQIAKILNQ